MSTKMLLAAITAVSFLAVPAMAQNADHHYQGGPKSPVPHHIGKETDSGPYQAWAYSPGTVMRPVAPVSKAHQYRGGPKSIH